MLFSAPVYLMLSCLSPTRVPAKQTSCPPLINTALFSLCLFPQRKMPFPLSSPVTVLISPCSAHSRRPWSLCLQPCKNGGEGNGTPLQYSCLENLMDGGAWWAAVHGVAKSQTRLSDFGNPLQCSCLENPRDGGAWCAAVYGVAQSRTRLKRLSSSSSSGLYNIIISRNCTYK